MIVGAPVAPSAAVSPRLCEMIGGPWDGDRTTARPWPIEIRTPQGAVTGCYVLQQRMEVTPKATRHLLEWHWFPEAGWVTD